MDDTSVSSTPAGTGEDYSSTTDTGIDIAHTVLDGLKSASKLASAVGIPYLGPAAEIALRLVSLAQQYRKNKVECTDLIKDACHIVYITHIECQEKCETYHAEKKVTKSKDTKGPIDPDFRDKLFRLLQTLENIDAQCKKMSERGPVRRYFAAGQVTSELAKLRSELDWAMKVFGFHTSLEIQNTLEKMAKKISEAHDHPQVQYSTTNLNMKANSIINIQSAQDCGNTYTHYHINGVFQTQPNLSHGMNGYQGVGVTAVQTAPAAGFIESP